MYVCGNADCNAVLGPYAPPVAQLTEEQKQRAVEMTKPAEVIELSPAELAEAAGNAAMLSGQPVSINSGAGFEPMAPLPAVAEKPMPPTADDIESDARRRLEFVRAEIAKLRGYESEEERLELMLSALAPASQERAAS
jgi:hypothetical protein